MRVGWLGRGNVSASILQPAQCHLPSFLALCRIAGCRGEETKAPKPSTRSTKKQRWRSIGNTSKCSSSCRRTRGEDPPGHPPVVSVWAQGHWRLPGVGCSCWAPLEARLCFMSVSIVPRWTWKPGCRRWLEHGAHQQGQPTHRHQPANEDHQGEAGGAVWAAEPAAWLGSCLGVGFRDDSVSPPAAWIH